MDAPSVRELKMRHWGNLFFRVLAETKEVKVSAERAGVTEQTVWYHVRTKPWFHARLLDALSQAAQD